MGLSELERDRTCSGHLPPVRDPSRDDLERHRLHEPVPRLRERCSPLRLRRGRRILEETARQRHALYPHRGQCHLRTEPGECQRCVPDIRSREGFKFPTPEPRWLDLLRRRLAWIHRVRGFPGELDAHLVEE